VAARAATDGDGVDIAIVGPGTVDALEAGRRSLAAGGTLLVFTPTPPDDIWSLPAHDLFFRETTIVPSYSAGPAHTREALRLLADGLPVEALITHRLSLAEAPAGYDLVRATGPALKVIVRP
jgi:L-iditol 2-dehydrogenase